MDIEARTMPPREIVCESRISHVTVYARGALVTREVTLPAALPAGPTDLAIAGITALARVGTARASLSGSNPGARAVVALRAELVVPEVATGPGPLLATLRDLGLTRAHLEAAREQLVLRRRDLAAITLTPALRGTPRRRVDAQARVGDALALSSVVTELLADLDARILTLDESLAQNARATAAAELAAAQGRSAERASASHPTFTVRVRLGAAEGAGEGDARTLALSYLVDAARWWPAYTARLSNAGARAEWTLGALVAQLSGEDWSGVRLALSTADAVHDARLPELPSLRLSRAQPAPRRGYRAPPAGLDAMFRGYDRLVARDPAPAASLPRETPRTLVNELISAETTESMEIDAALYDEGELSEDGGAEPAPETRTRAGTVSPARMRYQERQMAKPSAAMDRPAGAPGGARVDMNLAGPPKSAGFLARRAEPEMKKRAAPPHSGSSSNSLGGGGGGGGGAPADDADEATPGGIEPSDAWLDFDALVMGRPRDTAHRGRLTHRTEASMAGSIASSVNLLERVEVPPELRDPRQTRGQFDHRYEAEAPADVPSSSVPHRVPLGVAQSTPTVRLRVVPREAPEVYREAEMRNPFDAPLLAGPVDVFLDGALMTRAALGAVDRGGVLALGLGVEERVRVARNARADESHAGLLGGTTAIEHVVTIDLTSSLGHPIAAHVFDRVPVSDDKNVEVATLASHPAAESYDQAERGQPVRGGLRWKLELPAGGKSRVEFRYRVTLPGKNEIVGGNRRD